MLREQWIAHFTALARPYADLHLRRHDLPMVRREGMHFVTLSTWCQQAGRPDIMLKIFPVLAFYYDLTGQWTDLLVLGQIALEYAQLIGDVESIVFIEIHVLSWMLSDQGRHEEAERYIADALKTVRQLGDIPRQCEVLVNYARVFRRRKIFDRIPALFNDGLVAEGRFHEVGKGREYQTGADAILQLAKIGDGTLALFFGVSHEFKLGKGGKCRRRQRW